MFISKSSKDTFKLICKKKKSFKHKKQNKIEERRKVFVPGKKKLRQNISTTSCCSAGTSHGDKEHDGIFFFFARYHLSNSAAIGWLSLNLFYFLDNVNLVACLDGVIIYGHGQTVKKKKTIDIHLRLTWTDHYQRLGTDLFLHNLRKQWIENSMWKWSWLLFSA